MFHGQSIIPAIRNMKQFDRFLQSDFEFGVLLDSHLGQLKSLVDTGKKANKKLLIHVDLIQGLKHDEYAAEFLCQDIKPAGLISTRTSVIAKAKQKKVIAVQRLFLLDSGALDKSLDIMKKYEPDFVEVLPGIVPRLIQNIKKETNIPILAGGFIQTKEDIENALTAGATAVTTSKEHLWIE